MELSTLNKQLPRRDCVIYADEYLNGLNAETLEDDCERLIKKGITKIVINFRKTELINSIGISIIVGIIEKIKEVDGLLLFCNLIEAYVDTLEMLRITKYIKIVSSEQEAISIALE